MRLAAILLAALAVALLPGCGLGGDDDDSGGGGNALTGATEDGRAEQETTRVEVIRSEGTGSGFDAQAIYESESPGVVTVISLFEGSDLGSLGQEEGGESGVGSGFVLTGDGEIATNAHVVTTGEVPDLEEATQVYVEFADGNQVEAEVRGYDPEADVALLKVDPEGLALRPLPLGDAESVDVGESVAAIGSPFNERQSLSVGVVSAVDRSIAGLTAFQIAGAIQTDAAINPGNSGGPLVDGDGEVIGINQQIKSSSGGGEGVGFAVPIDVARRSLEQLSANGEVKYSYLGVETVDIYPQLRERYDLPVGEGAWVQGVTDDGPAAQGGLRGGQGSPALFQVRPYRGGGDVITSIDGRPVRDPDDLSRAVSLIDPGSTVTVEAWRDGDKRSFEVRLGERPLSGPQIAG
jgi:S1-C subfamily serine protease